MNKFLLVVSFFIICFTTIGQEINDKKIDKISIKKENGKDTIVVISQLAEYVGGPGELYKFINANITIPDSIQKGFMNGAVYTQFTITDSGKVKNVKMLYPMQYCSKCNSEALRVTKMLNKFIPEMVDNKYVSSIYTLPIYFRTPLNITYADEHIIGNWLFHGADEDKTCLGCPTINFKKDHNGALVSEDFKWKIQDNQLLLNGLTSKNGKIVILKDTIYNVDFSRWAKKLTLHGPTTTYYLYKN